MQPSPKYESNPSKQDNPPSQNSSAYRQSQGYITLSPARKLKDKAKNDRPSEKFEIEHQKSLSDQLGRYPFSDSIMKQNENGENLPVRTQQYFKKIPKYTLQEVIIRQAFAEGNAQNYSNKKKKLSVTKLFNNIDLSNRSQDGGSGSAAYKLHDFDAQK